MDYIAQIAAGMSWLDQHRPGWADRVDVSVLDMVACTSCVLGQLDGDYHTAGPDVPTGPRGNYHTPGPDVPTGPRGPRGPEAGWSLAHGFRADCDGFDQTDARVAWGVLTAQWRCAILTRRASGGAEVADLFARLREQDTELERLRAELTKLTAELAERRGRSALSP